MWTLVCKLGQLEEVSGLDGSLVGVIVPPLCPWQPLNPGAWFVTYKTPHIMFYNLIEVLGLPIGLRMIRGAMAHLSTTEHEGLPKLT